MSHVLEAASSGRAKCRACGQTIGKGEVRFGERAPNPFGEGEMTLWFHPTCAALAHPEPLLEHIEAGEDLTLLDDVTTLNELGKATQEQERLRRISGGQRSPTGRAKCRHCQELIAKDSWRVALGFFEDGRMQPGGFIHETCAEGYFGTADILDRVRHFSPDFQT